MLPKWIPTAMMSLVVLNGGGARAQAPGTIITVAGNGRTGVNAGGFSGDGGLAIQAQLMNPFGVAMDATGDLFIADTDNGRIRKVNPHGIITTVAGIGGPFSYQDLPSSPGILGPASSGDGGPATRGAFYNPYAVTVDASGDFFIADPYNERIRKVNPQGIISTIAGSGSGSGDTGFSGDGGPATQARLNSPSGVTVDALGNLFIADYGNGRIRKVSPQGIITTVAGTGERGFSGDGGPAIQAALQFPGGVTVDDFGDLFIADTYNQRIRKVSPTGIITTVAGSGPTGLNGGGYSGDGEPATQSRLNDPSGVAVDASGTLFIADLGNNRIREVSPQGIISTVAGTGAFSFSGDGGPAVAAQLDGPFGVSVDAMGDLFIADYANQRIREVVGIASRGLLAGQPLPVGKVGDLDFDGAVDILDVTLALRYVVGLAALSPVQLSAADVNKDGVVALSDVTAILRKAVKLP